MWSWAHRQAMRATLFPLQLHISGNFTFVNQQKRRFGVDLQFAHLRVVDLGCQQLIQHVHRGREQNALVGLAGFPSEDFGQEGLADAWVADQHDIGALAQEGEIEQAQNAILGLYAALVVVKVEGINAGLCL